MSSLDIMYFCNPSLGVSDTGSLSGEGQCCKTRSASWRPHRRYEPRPVFPVFSNRGLWITRTRPDLSFVLVAGWRLDPEPIGSQFAPSLGENATRYLAPTSPSPVHTGVSALSVYRLPLLTVA